MRMWCRVFLKFNKPVIPAYQCMVSPWNIYAKAYYSHAKAGIHCKTDLYFKYTLIIKNKMDSRFRGNDVIENVSLHRKD